MATISIQTKKVADLLEILSVADGDMLIIHDGNGMKKVSTQNFKSDLSLPLNALDERVVVLSDQFTTAKNLLDQLTYSGAGAHNSIYRGKFLGNAVTAAQYAAISSGTFDDLYIGDYWTISGVNYRIAAFDYYYRCGDNADLQTHHVVIVPDTSLYSATMNATNITTGGYMGSLMYTTNLAQAKTTINNAFSGHVLTHRVLLTNAVTSGKPSGGAWVNSSIELMNEIMVYGTKIFSPISDGTTINYDYTVSKSQLPLFAMRPDLISNRVTYWLRDVVSGPAFARVYDNGYAHYGNASNSSGVRPAFSIS